jgi:hypothetical protein
MKLTPKQAWECFKYKNEFPYLLMNHENNFFYIKNKPLINTNFNKNTWNFIHYDLEGNSKHYINCIAGHSSCLKYLESIKIEERIKELDLLFKKYIINKNDKDKEC